LTILGIDPGYAIVGFGVIRYDGLRSHHVIHGAIRTESYEELNDRLVSIYEDMNTLLDTYKPDAVAIEQLFFNTNTTTAINVAQARGIIALAAAQRHIPIAEYTPLQVKQAVVGYGRAEKKQVMEMTRILLHLEHIPKPDDAADALAIALCHATSMSSRLIERLNR